MDSAEIEALLAKFEEQKKIPIKKKGQVVPPPPELIIESPPEPVVEGIPKPGIAIPKGICFNVPFKKIIFQLPKDFVGQDDAKKWLLSLPDCPEPAKVS